MCRPHNPSSAERLRSFSASCFAPLNVPVSWISSRCDSSIVRTSRSMKSRTVLRSSSSSSGMFTRATSIVLPGDVRRLVHLEADAVAGPVDEALAVPGTLDDLAGYGVDVASRHARTDGLECRLLRLADDVVDLLEPVRGISDADGPGDVG